MLDHSRFRRALADLFAPITVEPEEAAGSARSAVSEDTPHCPQQRVSLELLSAQSPP